MNIKLNMAYKYCLLLKNNAIKMELDNILSGYFLQDIQFRNGSFECSFSNNKQETIELTLNSKMIHLIKYQNNALSRITIMEDQILRQIDVEKRCAGMVFTEIEKQFALTKRFKNKNVLVDLCEKRYVFKNENELFINELLINDNLDDVSLMKLLLKFKSASKIVPLENVCDFYTKFSTHLNNYANSERSNITYLNGEELSSIYDSINGEDKLYRIYDLYNGIINPRNLSDINSIHFGFLSQDAFDVKSLKGIRSAEDDLIGKSEVMVSEDYIDYLKQTFYDKFGYSGEINLDRETLIKAITYKMTAREIAKRTVERKLGIPYEEYEKLDTDEQHKLIEQKTGKKVKPDYRLRIDGIPMDKDHIITREQIDKRIDDLTSNGLQRILRRIIKRKK